MTEEQLEEMANENRPDSPLPSEIMPSCWNEEDRINALFSPLRGKSANPQDWSSKYKFWKNLILEWLRFKMRCSFTLADLTNNFKKGDKVPHCLPTVIDELLRSGDVVLESDFLKEPSETWTAWSLDLFLKKPLAWSLVKVKSLVVDSKMDKDTAYVHLQALRELGKIAMSVLRERKERERSRVVATFSEIARDCRTYEPNGDNITDDSLMFALISLKREKKVCLKRASDQSELLVKLTAHSTDVITETEEGLYYLMKEEEALLGRIRVMEEEKVKLIGEAKAYLAKQMRQTARLRLRKKMQLERAIERRTEALGSLQHLVYDIENSQTNVAVLSAYKIGSTALKKLADEGLTESNVRNIIDEISESLDEQEEVQGIISSSRLNDSAGQLDAELEEELERLTAADPDTTPIPESPDIEEIEHRMQSLTVRDLPPHNQRSGAKVKRKIELSGTELR